jgi:hypothetical protein
LIEFSVAALAADFSKVSAISDADRWDLKLPSPLEVLAGMRSAKDPDELYQARLLWAIYPDSAPSLKFRDPDTGRLDLSTAWPLVRGFRPGNLDACVNYCAEGLVTHKEWTTDPSYRWDPRGNVLLKVLRILQSELDEFYEGRFRG